MLITANRPRILGTHAMQHAAGNNFLMKSPGMSVVALLSLLLFYVDASEARLVRSSGRTSLSSNDGQIIYYAAPGTTNQFGLTQEAFDDLFSLPSRVPIDQNRGVAAVPGGTGGCIKPLLDSDVFSVNEEIQFLRGEQAQVEVGSPAYNDFEDQIDALNLSIANEPCTWEFEEGEPLELFGAFSMFFDVPAISYDVNWNIRGNGQTFVLPGEVNTEGERISAGGDLFRQGAGVFLNSPAPAGLTVGLYDVFVTVALDAPGSFFLESLDNGIDWEEVCGPDPASTEGEEICGWNTFEDGFFDPFDPQPVSAPSTFFSTLESLRIVPGSDDPVAVSAPSTLLCSLLGLLFVSRRRSR